MQHASYRRKTQQGTNPCIIHLPKKDRWQHKRTTVPFGMCFDLPFHELLQRCNFQSCKRDVCQPPGTEARHTVYLTVISQHMTSLYYSSMKYSAELFFVEPFEFQAEPFVPQQSNMSVSLRRMISLFLNLGISQFCTCISISGEFHLFSPSNFCSMAIINSAA